MNKGRVQWVVGAILVYTVVAALLGVLVRAQPYKALDEYTAATPRLDRVTSDVADLRVTVATLTAQYASVRDELFDLRRGQDIISGQINAAMWAAIALLGSIAFGLLGVMWSIRKGWLAATADPKLYVPPHA